MNRPFARLTRSGSRLLLALVGLGGLSVGCASVLGIDDYKDRAAAAGGDQGGAAGENTASGGSAGARAGADSGGATAHGGAASFAGTDSGAGSESGGGAGLGGSSVGGSSAAGGSAGAGAGGGPASCGNSLRDANEDGVDCGGSCAACPTVDWGEAKVYGLAYARDKFLYALSTTRKTIDRIDPVTGRYSVYRYLPAETPTDYLVLLRSHTGTVLIRAEEYCYEMIPETGALTLIASPTLGVGASLAPSAGSSPSSSSLAEGSDGALYATTTTTTSTLVLVRIERASGDRSVVASATVGTGAPLPTFYESPRLAVGETGNVLVFGSGAIVSVDPVSKARSALSVQGSTRWPFPGGTPSYVDKRSDAPGQYDVVFRYGPYSINEGQTTDATAERIELDSGTATFSNLSGPFNTRAAPAFAGVGTRFIYPFAIAGGEAGETFVLDPSFPAVIRINDSTGDRSVVGDTTQSRGSGPELSEPVAVSVGSDNEIYVAEFLAGQHAGNKAIFRVDPTTGNRTIISSNVDGSGVFYAIENEVVTGLVRQGNYLFMTLDVSGTPRTIQIDLTSKNRSETTTPPAMPALKQTTLGGSVYAVSASGTSISKDGSTIVSSNSVGTGPKLRNVQAIVGTAGNQLLVVDARSGLLLQVDPSTGDRTLVSGVPLP